jgi:hypothetical protein
MAKRIFPKVILTVIGTTIIIGLLILGDSFSAPTPSNSGGAPHNRSIAYPKGSSDSNYTILCVKKGDAKVKFTKTGPFVSCPSDFLTVPVQIDLNPSNR